MGFGKPIGVAVFHSGRGGSLLKLVLLFLLLTFICGFANLSEAARKQSRQNQAEPA
jgi:hypothetical protein